MNYLLDNVAVAPAKEIETRRYEWTNRFLNTEFAATLEGVKFARETIVPLAEIPDPKDRSWQRCFVSHDLIRTLNEMGVVVRFALDLSTCANILAIDLNENPDL